MADDDDLHRQRIAACLRSLRPDPTIVRYEVLQGGISGASTYRVELPHEHVVLKVAAATSPQDVLERTRREASFYRELSSHVPLRTPALLGAGRDAAAEWLCLAAYEPAPSIQEWTEDRYLEVAEQLGRFHAGAWNRVEHLSRFPWLRSHGLPVDAATVGQAAASWLALGQNQRFGGILTADEIMWIQGHLSRIDRLEAVLGVFPTSLCHGDCHHGNLLVDNDGEWVWADWQEVGIGRGPEDLSFLFQRARTAGGTVPEDAAIRAYQQSLEAATGQTVPLIELKRVIDSSELRTLLVHWPPFLSQLSAPQLAGIVGRMHDIAEGL